MNSDDTMCPTCHRPYTKELPRIAARNTDPSTSKEAVLNKAMRWNSMSMLALRVLYDNMGGPALSHSNIQCVAETRWGAGCLGVSPWKRCSELITKYDPPLMECVGEVEGPHDTPVKVFRITPEGMAWYLRGLRDEE